MNRFGRIAALSALSLVVAAVTLGVAQAQESYPNRPIMVNYGYQPGGNEAVMQPFTNGLAEALGGNARVVIDYKPGGGTMLAASATKNARPDGYTLFYATPALVTSALGSTATVDPFKGELTPVSLLAKGALAVLVTSNSNINSLKELIAYAKAHPGELNFGSGGTGTFQHFAGEGFKMQAGVDMLHIPYSGMSPLLTDAVSGRIQVMFAAPFGVMSEYVKTGQLKILASTSLERASWAPEAPTVAETLPGYEMVSWQGLFAPPNLPKPILDRLVTALQSARFKEIYAKGLKGLSYDPAVTLPEGLTQIMAQDRDRTLTLNKQLGIKLD